VPERMKGETQMPGQIEWRIPDCVESRSKPVRQVTGAQLVEGWYAAADWKGQHRRLQILGYRRGAQAPQSPWQNPYTESLIGSIRRECLNHFVILSAGHLRKMLARYFDYYHRSRST
jgi:hypothetical protein